MRTARTLPSAVPKNISPPAATTEDVTSAPASTFDSGDSAVARLRSRTFLRELLPVPAWSKRKEGHGVSTVKRAEPETPGDEDAVT